MLTHANTFSDPALWLPLVFVFLMGLSILIYVILDGFDLGVGLLLPLAEDAEKDRMIAAIGPFWDANETWLVLSVGILLVAFPIAHGVILTAFYLPVAIMLIGLILRGVSFEFRAKAEPRRKDLWNRWFFIGSLATTLSQGSMLGLYIMGLDITVATVGFSLLTAVCLVAGYALVGAGWVILKTDGALQRKAVVWGQRALLGVAAGMVAISLASPLVSPRIFEKWFGWPQIAFLAPLPLLSATMFGLLWFEFKKLPRPDDRYAWAPFVTTAGVFVLAFAGLAYSFYPYVVPERITLYEAAAAPESLMIILVGTLFVLPVILGYTVFAYKVFSGKATELRYD